MVYTVFNVQCIHWYTLKVKNRLACKLVYMYLHHLACGKHQHVKHSSTSMNHPLPTPRACSNDFEMGVAFLLTTFGISILKRMYMYAQICAPV